jgi:hypothetical protein
MAYVLRFVQRYRPADREVFMNLEAQFVAMEQRRPEWPQGKRRQPYASREQVSTLIWECEFGSLAEIQQALAVMSADREHEELFRKQVPYMAEAYTEIDEILEL